ncbi:MAG: homoserine O-acetyltransferase [Alphaproteobacteria bacterium]
MRRAFRAAPAIAAAMLLLATPARAYDDPVTKQTFEMPSYTTVGGKTIKKVRVGWEAYGKLSPNKDNVILVTHFFSGDSHAAGKYKPGDAVPGYWNSIIGPGKPLDTNKYYVISSDTLVNLSAKNPGVVTTGPASINPDTGKPYGLDFPIVTIRDFVNVQKALLESLGITRLEAVMGASMGALQAIEWAAAYPDMVKRVIPVIGAGEIDGWAAGWLDIWASPIRLDPNWNNGAYYGKAEPEAGLALALKIVTLHAQNPARINKAFGKKWAKEGADPLASFDNLYAVSASLNAAAAARAKVADANHFLYLARANELFVAGHGGSIEDGLKKIKAPMLLLPAKGDLLLFPAMSARVRDIVKANGGQVEYLELVGDFGHLDGVVGIAQASDAIKAFLAK